MPSSKFHSSTPGVTFRKDRPKTPWRCRIQVDKVTYYLGCYETEAEAAEVAVQAYQRIYGQQPQPTRR